MKKTFFVGTLMGTLLLSSCATIVSGSKQKISFMSTPVNAVVFVDGVEVGKTPFETKLARNTEHQVKIQLEGYKPFETKLEKKVNGWVWGNIVFGGLIGLLVDGSTGAIYRLTPSEIDAKLQNGVAYRLNKSDIHIAVALEVDPSWEKIGQLEKL